MIREELISYAKRKNMTGKLLIIFLIMMVLLTFFSNTINNFMLPRVTLDSPARGALIKEITGQGTIDARVVYEEYIDANASLTVKDVNVDVGDNVKKGQTIMSLDIDDIKSSLQDENAKYRQMQISLDKLKDSGGEAAYDNNIQTALENKDQKAKDYENIKTLYDSGYESANNLQNAKTAMDDAERSYNSALQAKETYLRNNERDIENSELNLEMEARKISDLNKQISNGGVYTAPSDGVITEINFSKSSVANNSKPLYKLAETNGGFQLTISADSGLIDYVKTGDPVDVDVTSLGDKMITGKISEIKENLQDGDMKDIVIDLNDQELRGGENASVYISKKTKQYQTLVPNSAVYSDSDGDYILVVRKKDGPLGTENYLQRFDVTVADSDSSKSAIENGISPMDKFVVQSSKPVSDGDRVVVEQ